MMALSVLSIGATGVIAMQKTTLIGNVNARNLATANAIATGWIERLRVDGLRWSQQPNGLSTISSTAWLSAVNDGDYPTVSSPEGTWFVPTANGLAGVEVGADVRGMDVAAAADQGFCTAIRLTQLLPNLIRAEVRVYWLRNSGGGVIGGGDMCKTTGSYQDDLDTPLARQRYHFVYLTSSILRNDQ